MEWQAVAASSEAVIAFLAVGGVIGGGIRFCYVLFSKIDRMTATLDALSKALIGTADTVRDIEKRVIVLERNYAIKEAKS
jgi:hypothetical protein